MERGAWTVERGAWTVGDLLDELLSFFTERLVLGRCGPYKMCKHTGTSTYIVKQESNEQYAMSIKWSFEFPDFPRF